MAIEFARIYFVKGGAPKYWRHRYEITDPPTSGYGHVIIIRGDRRSTILCPFTLVSYQISNNSGEMQSATPAPVSVEKLAGFINRSWEECVKLGFQRDFGVAAMVLTELGQPVPKFLPPPPDPRKMHEESKRGGKAINEEALKPCKPSSKRGQVAAFFMQDTPQSLHEAMAKLELTRSGVLSHLFTLNRDHGVGYELVSDCARLLIPEGFDLFAYVEPEKPVKAEKAEGDAPAPKKRSSGKPINEAALKPIPEPGKRATVAKLFVDGWRDITSACAELSLDRSAVLSHLFTINKENGLGYELSDDSSQARLLIPDGHQVFGAKVPRTKKAKEAEQASEDLSWLE